MFLCRRSTIELKVPRSPTASPALGASKIYYRIERSHVKIIAMEINRRSTIELKVTDLMRSLSKPYLSKIYYRIERG